MRLCQNPWPCHVLHSHHALKEPLYPHLSFHSPTTSSCNLNFPSGDTQTQETRWIWAQRSETNSTAQLYCLCHARVLAPAKKPAGTKVEPQGRQGFPRAIGAGAGKGLSMGWNEVWHFQAGGRSSDGPRRFSTGCARCGLSHRQQQGPILPKSPQLFWLIPRTAVPWMCRQLPAASGVARRKLRSTEGWTGFCCHKCLQEIPLVMERPCKWTTRAAQRCVVSQPGFLCLCLTHVPSL